VSLREINFDGIVGPSHNYAGLSLGNLASAQNAGAVSKPRAAALQGIDPHGRVLYAGTFSKVMFSGLRLGYLVAPPDLVATMVRARELMDRQSPGIQQAVMADFMTEGHFARHLRRMRTVYASRLAALTNAVREHAPDLLEIAELEGGLNRVAWLPDGISDSDAVAALQPEGFACLPVSEFRLRPGGRGGLVLGFAGMTEESIEGAIRRMAGILRPMLQHLVEA